MLAIKNCVIVRSDHYIPDGVILTDGGRVTGLGRARDTEIPDNAVVYDAGGAFAGPGLLDIHTHAADGKYFYEDPIRAGAHLLKHGVTGVLPALYFNLNKAEYLSAIELIRSAVEGGACPNIMGLYMEGPYLNPKFGCDRENNHWKGEIKQDEYADIVKSAKSLAKVWSVAPERAGIREFAEYVKREIEGVVFSVAHSEASPAQTEALMPFGLRLATHHTNATGDLPKYPECRGVCVDETVNYRDDIYAELICDERGIHVDPYMLRLIVKIKGKDKIILISDACAFDGPVPDGYEGVTDINFDDSGEIAGSKLTLDVACRNMIMHTGCSVRDAFQYASGNPAKLLNLSDRGEIRTGARADIVIADCFMNVQRVIFKGEIVA